MTDPREVLVGALADIAAIDVPDELREVAFSKMLDLRARTMAPALGQTGPVAGAGATPNGAGSEPSGDVLRGIADRLGVDRSTVAEVYDDNDGLPILIIPAGKLPSKVAAAASEIALLVAGGRQAAGIEEWTNTDEIRTVCDDFKKLDSGNFSKTMRRMEDVLKFKNASERKLLVSLAKPGWEQYAATVKRLGGES